VVLLAPGTCQPQPRRLAQDSELQTGKAGMEASRRALESFDSALDEQMKGITIFKVWESSLLRDCLIKTIIC
jgi:hypothetical protein